MHIVIQPPAKRAAPTAKFPTLILVSDYWNDYGYKTLFHLWIERADSDLEQIGSVRILGKGQAIGEVRLVPGEIVSHSLGSDYCSLGIDLDYYSSISELEIDIREKILSSLGDIAYDKTLIDNFRSDDGYSKSLQRDRDSKGQSEFLLDAKRTLQSGGKLPKLDDFVFTYKDANSGLEIKFDFSNPNKSRSVFSFGVPNRFNVIVGPNGTGKTALLSRLARLAYASPRERNQLLSDGQILEDVGFPSIVAVSYSAFDSFKPPKLSGDDAEAFADKLRSGDGRYIYCGLRDISHSFSADSSDGGKIISRKELADSFAARYQSIRDQKRENLLAKVMIPILAEGSLLRARGTPEIDKRWDDGSNQMFATHFARNAIEEIIGNNPAEALLRMSSGHQIVLHIVFSLLASARQRGLVLIDEPETHLHPPLLAALMAAIRLCIDELQAYCIIATHSPVVAQETLTSKIGVLSKVGTSTVSRHPTIETFGENVGVLTREIFGLFPSSTDFRGALDKMMLVYKSIDSIEAEFGAPLSAQARAYVMMNMNVNFEEK